MRLLAPPLLMLACLLLQVLLLVTVQPAHGATLCEIGSNEYGCTSAMFGVQPVRSTLVGTVVDARNGVLSDGSTAAYGCGQFNVSSNADWVQALATGANMILLIDRGNCPFIEKVYHAQSATYNGSPAGVNGVIVVYDSDPNPLPFMTKTSNLYTVSILSVLVSASSGALIRRNVSPVAASIQFFVPNPDGTVEYALVASVARDGSVSATLDLFTPGPLDILRSSWYTVADTLSSTLVYTPFIRLQRGCTNSSYPQSLCATACTNSQRYCAPLPIPAAVLASNGAYKIVQEAMRQYALYLILKDKGNVGGMFTYYRMWYSSTNADCLAYEESCSLRIMQIAFLGNDYGTQVMSAIKRNGQGYDPGTASSNSIAETMLAALLDFAPMETASTFYVNQAPVSANPSCPSPIRLFDCALAQVVCDSFDAGTAPSACYYDVTCPFGQQRDHCGQCDGNDDCKSNSLSVGVVVAIAVGSAVAIALAIAIVVLAYRHWRQKKQGGASSPVSRSSVDSLPLAEMSLGGAHNRHLLDA